MIVAPGPRPCQPRAPAEHRATSDRSRRPRSPQRSRRVAAAARSWSRAHVALVVAFRDGSGTIVMRESAGGRSAIAGRNRKGLSMSHQHVSWGSIELLHNVVRTLAHLHELGAGFPVVEYRAK